MLEMMPKTKYFKRRMAQLRDEFDNWRDHFQDLQEYILPRRSLYLDGSPTDQREKVGGKRSQKILNSTATDAVRILAAGMQGGMTSPSRPWFTLAISDTDLMEFARVKSWLFAVQKSMLTVFSRSNFYGAIHSMYKELAVFGTSAMLIEEDFKTVIRCRPFTIGEFYLGSNSVYRADSLYRQFSQTARQMVEMFGEDRVTQAVKTAINSGRGEQRFEVMHAIQPSTDMDPSKIDYRGMPFVSYYFQKACEETEYLRHSGYREQPFVAPRWDVTGINDYGDSIGMMTLGDVKMLQKMDEKKLKALDKMVDPPMNAPTALRKKGGTVISGGVNYIDVSQGQQSFTPAYQLNPDFQKLAFEIDRVESRIKRAFYNDLFLAILDTQKNMTATEVAERHTEKMVMLGPVIERLQSEMLDPVIDRTFGIMQRFNLLPPIPRELEGRDIKVEYISLLSQAQKMVGTNAIDQLFGSVAIWAQTNPEVVDKIDYDQGVDQYAEMLGTPPNLVKSDQAVAQVRKSRQQALAQQQALETAKMAADSGKVLSETKLNQDSALDEAIAQTQ